MVTDRVTVNGSTAHPIFYYMYDGKMLYSLTQHGNWNRKHHPFLLCKCRRGMGVAKPKHRFSKKLDRAKKNGAVFTSKMHMDWADMRNYGISHFGVHPTLLLPSSIHFDVFHLRSAMTRKLLGCLQT
eukprot:9129507-Ditylum_brightwellii.AAC.1